ncbi:hypothetical protein SUGI_0018480 [Cryptomeria japonica]|uniref:myb-related protein 315 n=1 Tax=Cryptomeria japonica TaxID=3369 RepID=UPI002408C242|nr:myb-related protein 315 [Cryptomeria japonica]GLJ05454.1 hypothetical protein SUGI_0018480 [Cryptomeria japonica]
MGRTPCCSEIGLNRGPWTPQEDALLTQYVQKNGEGGWRTLPKKAGLWRCGKSCRLRWMNYLRPDVKRGQILPDEEDLILRLHRLLGNRWSLIAGRIPGRTDNEIKNFWNTHLSKKLISQGIDPRTHKPLSEPQPDDRDDNSVDRDSEKNLSPEACVYSQETTSIEDNGEATCGLSDNLHAPQLIRDGEVQETQVTSSPHHAFMFQDRQYPTNTDNMNSDLNPYSNGAPKMGFHDHDASLFMRKNSITNSFFVAPAMPDSDLESVPSFPGNVNESSSTEEFPMSFEQSEMQQCQVPNEFCMDTNLITPSAATEDCDSDIFSYFLESFMDDDQLYTSDENNTNVASSLSDNRQNFLHAETPNQHGYDKWSTMPSSSASFIECSEFY